VILQHTATTLGLPFPSYPPRNEVGMTKITCSFPGNYLSIIDRWQLRVAVRVRFQVPALVEFAAPVGPAVSLPGPE
jgi:hypothetical protein